MEVEHIKIAKRLANRDANGVNTAGVDRGGLGTCRWTWNNSFNQP
jgi:hypothetical protein